MVAVATHLEPGERERVVDEILARVAREPGVSRRSRRTLLRAARAGRLVVARDGDRLVSWVLSEPCGPGVHELGYLFVEPAYREGGVLRAVTVAAVAMRRRSVVVTTNARFAEWLTRTQGFRETSLGGIAAASRGMFLLRRLDPRRLREARRQLRSARPVYLVRERVSP